MNTTTNPLLSSWTTPHGLPPFDRIEASHFEPAFAATWAAHRAELDAIAAQSAPPSFENTLAAFDRAGAALQRVELVFHNLTASHSTPALQAAELALAGPRAAHESWVLQHAELFARIDALHRERAALGLQPEQLRLLERVHLDFVLAGAALAPAARERAAAIAQRLADLYTRFNQNLLADESEWALPLAAEADLDGLPATLVAAAREAGAQRGSSVPVVALSRSLALPFLTHSTRRELRERVWRAWVARGEGAFEGGAGRDNRPLAAEILQLRIELAGLHGFENFADYALRDRMAGTPAAVNELLQRAWQPARAKAAVEQRELAALGAELGIASSDASVQPWDWRFLEEQQRQRRARAAGDAELKDHFALEAMIGAMFDCAGRLFGLRFAEKRDCALYHPDVRLWEVYDERNGGALLGIFLGDNFARPGKRGGAWMSVYRSQQRNGGAQIPIVVNNNNFAKAPAGEPTLLSTDDVRTLFHEFGHGLHGLLSNVHYRRLAGTQVLQDFVELPSQLFEHWAFEPEILARHALHAQTGAALTPAQIEALRASGAGSRSTLDSVQYIAAALVDMALHEQAQLQGFDLGAFEAATRERIGVPAGCGLMHRPPQFRHLFAGDSYAAGYYVYIWAEVLDADAAEAFREAGDAFDGATAARLLKHVYSAGNTVEPRATYRAFRGRDAVVEPMLKKRGLIAA
ncbi:M3 family metallopeptidase [Rivibacter subsaxonicus]|uniref:Peptidyl-dipeptidase Dcp n=1 Tax=Rivibacter subsaxonicus TaxID=457575 RepID=A0A4Q7VGC8_9BURK|nr:M3 family metallopeptidase [Rivibacter subsaxonicus]RZT95086.1 peptidyl-dipeptidase Dcp [Rivibacter subsaxonicus]